ncbi:MAG: ComEC/Rec2 family competence protein [Clostridia bacterium]|nr:ComEC/Rec2 family competence protein [Clostridia bacterium]
MNIFKNRPIALGCAIFILALVASYFLPWFFSLILIAVAIGMYAFFFITYKITKNEMHLKRLAKITAICILLIVCAVVSAVVFKNDEKVTKQYLDKKETVRLIIDEEIYRTDFGSAFIAKIKDEYEFKVLLNLKDKKALIGDEIEVTVKFRDLQSSEIGYNEKEFYLDQRVLLAAEQADEEYSIISSDNYSFKHYFLRINLKLDETVKQLLNEESASLVSAILLGNKGELENNVKRDFSYLGISHVLALSGMHLSLMISLMGAFLNTFRLDKKFKYIILSLMIFLFVAVTGFSKSALRAGIMVLIFYFLYYFGIAGDTISALFLSVTLICIISPYSVFSTSLILSFLAMLACVASTYFSKKQHVIRKIRLKFLRSIVYTFITSLFVTIFTLPIIFMQFNYISLAAPISNIVIVPIITILLYISPFVIIFANVPYISVGLKYICEFITEVIYTITSSCAKIPEITVSFSNWGHRLGVFIIVIALLMIIALPYKKAKYSFTTLLIGILIFTVATVACTASRRNEVSIQACQYEYADIVSLESNGSLMIIEASKPSKKVSDWVSFYQGYLGYSKIDIYALCDYSLYMDKAIDSVTDRTFIECILIPEPTDEKERYMCWKIQKICKEKNIDIGLINDTVKFEEAEIIFMEKELLSSGKRCVSYRIEANNSVCTYVGSGNRSVLNYFISDSISISDLVIFGSYGPSSDMPYEYEADALDCCVFLGRSAELCGMNISLNQIKPELHKFIFN